VKDAESFFDFKCTFLFQLTGAPTYQRVTFALLSFYPGLIVIDHGHFQYNGISLGLAVATMASMLAGHDVLTCLCFVGAVCYKQMELYHSLPVFCYLLGSCMSSGFLKGFRKLLKIAFVTVAAFVAIFSPFLMEGGPTSVGHVLKRVFPSARGIYEDKVWS